MPNKLSSFTKAKAGLQLAQINWKKHTVLFKVKTWQMLPPPPVAVPIRSITCLGGGIPINLHLEGKHPN